MSRRVEKPWGHEDIWHHGPYTAKTLHVRPGHRLSLQLHEQKVETIYVCSGRAAITVGTDTREYRIGEVVHIPAGVSHRLEAVGSHELIVFEVATPELDDVIRLDDDYGRAPDASAA